MKAMVLQRTRRLDQVPNPLELVEVPIPKPQNGELLLQVAVCGVCHTELDQVEGRIMSWKLPMIPGHQVIGKVVDQGPGCSRYQLGDRVGVAWIFSACGHCTYCIKGQENLCEAFEATGIDAPGGYAEYMVVSETFAYPIPEALSDGQAAPLLCAGAIGYRSLKLAGLDRGKLLGLTGFGASAHLVLKSVQFLYPDMDVYVFARKEGERSFARELGAIWAGDTHERCPVELDAIIDTTPAWTPVVEALGNLARGGRLVINAIRKESNDQIALQLLSYQHHLWMEKEIKSVANITRADVSEFLALAAKAGIRPHVEYYGLEQANMALRELKHERVHGAKVLRCFQN